MRAMAVSAVRLIGVRGITLQIRSSVSRGSIYAPLLSSKHHRSIHPASQVRPPAYSTSPQRPPTHAPGSSSSTALEPNYLSDSPEGDEQTHFSTRAKPPPRWFQRPVVWVLALMPILTFGLGVWQIKRLRWKLDLIDELESKLRREPLSLPKNIDLDVLLGQFVNRLFLIDGRFADPTPDSIIFLGPRVRDGQVGYHVVQPLKRDGGGGQILVDRGFVPKEKILNYQDEPARWRLMDTAFDDTSQTHLCLLPRPKERNRFTPANEPGRRVWYFADVDELVAYFTGSKEASKNKAVENDDHEAQDSYTPSYGIAESVRSMLGMDTEPEKESVLPVYMEEIFEGNVADAARYLQAGKPVGRAATVELRNQHAVYAATWFSLSAATSVMLGLLIRRTPRTRRS